MKKWSSLLFACLLLFSFASCKEKDPAAEDVLGNVDLSEPADDTALSSALFTEGWPTEFDAWQVPTLGVGQVTSGTNLDEKDGVFSQGVSATTVVSGVSKADIDAYGKTLEQSGFAPVSGGDAASTTYEKKTGDETVSVTVTYSEDGTAEIKTENSAAAAAASTLQWPAKVTEIPVFDKGVFQGTTVWMESPSAIYLMAFKGASDGDVKAYFDGLVAAGFVSNGGEPLVYEKTVGSTRYSVGPLQQDGVFQLVLAADPV